MYLDFLPNLLDLMYNLVPGLCGDHWTWYQNWVECPPPLPGKVGRMDGQEEQVFGRESLDTYQETKRQRDCWPIEALGH